MKLYRNTWIALQPDPSIVKQIALSLGLSFSLSKWLHGRGYDLQTIPNFLEPSLNAEYMVGEKEAAKLVLEAVRRRARIAVLGDYDVDGISACALMYHFFRDNAVEVEIILPNRYEEGYGLNAKSLEKVTQVDLLLTVDCGITSTQEVEILKNRGIDVVVTDHHEPRSVLPRTVCMNPKLGDYPFRHLAGVGVAYKLCVRLAESGMHLSDKLLELACLGTIADVMPLKDENRYLVKYGLEKLGRSSIPGLKALIEALHLKAERTAADVSFRIAPVLNAAGRMNTPLPAYRLLIEEDPATIQELIFELLACNEKRKAAEQHILQELDKRMINTEHFIVEKGDWLKGVLGLAASRAVEKYRLPVILLTEADTLEGSGRSIGTFHLLHALEANAQYLKRYGGHAQAAGLELEPEQFEALRSQLEHYAALHLRQEDREQHFSYYELSSREVRLEMIDELERLQPFGVGNPMPLFRMDGLQLKQRRMLQEGKATAMLFEKQGRQFQAITFETLPVDFVLGRDYDLLVQLQKNEFRGVTQIQLMLKDMRPTAPTLDVYSPVFSQEMERMASLVLHYSAHTKNEGFALAVSGSGMRLNKLGHLSGLLDDRHLLQSQFIDHLPDREKLIEWYRYFKKYPRFDLADIKQPFSMYMALKIFEELGIISYTKIDLSISITHNDRKEKLALTKSRLFAQGLKLREDFHELNRHHPSD